MKKKQRKVRLIRAAIQLIFFIAAPSLFSTAFAGVKSIFLAIGGQQSVTWNSFLDITALLLIITILFGRHFCGYACAFGSLGDALYELTAFIRAKCFGKKKKHGYPEEWVHRLQKVKYVLLIFLLLSCITGFYSKLQGMSPWDVFSMLTTGRLPKSTYIVGTVLLILIMAGMCTQERFFCQFLCPMGAVFALLPVLPFARLHRQSDGCIPGCNACKQQCPVCLKLEESSLRSGECIACEACVGTCPKQNIRRWDMTLCKSLWLPVLTKALLFFLLGCWLGFCRFI